MCLNALYMILLWWVIVCFWMRFIWYYYNFRLYLSECALKVIIKMRACMCQNALYMVLLKWELLFVWTRFILYYYDGRFYLSESALKYIIKMRAFMSECVLYDIIKMTDFRLNALYKLLLWWEILFVWMRFESYCKNESLYVSECALYDVTEMRTCMCLNAL